MIKRYSLFLALSALLILSSSCAPKNLGWGVVLWSVNEEKLPTGSFVTVYEESKLLDNYIIGLPGMERKYDYDRWRVQLFEEKSEAESFAAEYQAYDMIYAYSTREGYLPIREAPDNSDGTKIVYRLNKNRNIKVIKKITDEVKIGRLTGYWYQILTDDGVQGFCFDYYLKLFSKDEEENERLGDQEVRDTLLTNFLAAPWYPQYFQYMIDSKTIDLDRFKSTYGIFPAPDESKKEIVISAPGHSKKLTYEEITTLGYSSNKYLFKGDDNFQVTLWSMGRIHIEYTVGTESYNGDYVRLSENVNKVITEEVNRRQEQFNNFFYKGNKLESTAYGTITLASNKSFRWKNNDRLIPNIIPSSAGENGILTYGIFLSQSLRRKYAGVVTFKFTKGQEVHFFYNFTSAGVQMTYIPKSNINSKTETVEKESSSPFVIFFSFERE